MTNIEELAARVAALEADRCHCTGCFTRRNQQAEAAFAQRAYAIRALPVAERIEAIKALDPGTAQRVIGRFDRETHVATALAAPDMRERLLAHADQIVRDLVAVNLLADQGTLPAHVRVTNKTGNRERFPERELRVDSALAKTLTDAGFTVHATNSVEGIADRKLQTRTVYRFHSPTIILSRLFTPEEWAALLAADEVIRAAVESADLVVHELTRDENIRIWLDDPHRHSGEDLLANFRKVTECELSRARVEKEFLR